MADLDQPFPDRGKEGIRQLLKQTEADVEWNTSSVDMGFELTDTLFGLVSAALDAVTALQADVAELTARLAALATTPPEASP